MHSDCNSAEHYFRIAFSPRFKNLPSAVSVQQRPRRLLMRKVNVGLGPRYVHVSTQKTRSGEGEWERVSATSRSGWTGKWNKRPRYLWRYAASLLRIATAACYWLRPAAQQTKRIHQVVSSTRPSKVPLPVGDLDPPCNARFFGPTWAPKPDDRTRGLSVLHRSSLCPAQQKRHSHRPHLTLVAVSAMRPYMLIGG